MKWVLIIYLGSQSNFAVVDEFNTQIACMEKYFRYEQALQQAKSDMKVLCVKQ